MAPTETKAAAEVMLGASRGEKIQYRVRTCHEWDDCISSPTWDWNTSEYRVKPKPRECYVRFSENGKFVDWAVTSKTHDDLIFMREVEQ